MHRLGRLFLRATTQPKVGGGTRRYVTQPATRRSLVIFEAAESSRPRPLRVHLNEGRQMEREVRSGGGGVHIILLVRTKSLLPRLHACKRAGLLGLELLLYGCELAFGHCPPKQGVACALRPPKGPSWLHRKPGQTHEDGLLSAVLGFHRCSVNGLIG